MITIKQVNGEWNIDKAIEDCDMIYLDGFPVDEDSLEEIKDAMLEDKKLVYKYELKLNASGGWDLMVW